jgi:hypothetical protein
MGRLTLMYYKGEHRFQQHTTIVCKCAQPSMYQALAWESVLRSIGELSSLRCSEVSPSSVGIAFLGLCACGAFCFIIGCSFGLWIGTCGTAAYWHFAWPGTGRQTSWWRASSVATQRISGHQHGLFMLAPFAAGVRQLADLLRNLRVATPGLSDGDGPGAELVEGTAASGTLAPSSPVLEGGARRAAASVRSLEELHPRLVGLAARLGFLGGLSGEGRIRRAFGAGRSAQGVLEGRTTGVEVIERLSARGSPSGYVILCFGSGDLREPCWVSSYRLYSQLLGDPAYGLPVGSVSRAFHSRAESEAYCLGAGFTGLVEKVDTVTSA